MLVEGFFLCMVGEGFGTTFIFLCMLLLSSPSLAFLVLVRIHCDFNNSISPSSKNVRYAFIFFCFNQTNIN